MRSQRLFLAIVAILSALLFFSPVVSAADDDYEDMPFDQHMTRTVMHGKELKLKVAIDPASTGALSFIASPLDGSMPRLVGRVDESEDIHAQFGFGAAIVYINQIDLNMKKAAYYTLSCPGEHDCRLGMIASFERETALAAGDPMYSYMTKQEGDYYVYTLPDGADQAVLSVTQVKEYVNVFVGLVSRPSDTAKTAKWRSLHDHMAPIVIPASELPERKFFVTVLGAASVADITSEYTITVVSGTTPSVLAAGIARETVIAPKKTVAFTYEHTRTDKSCALTFALTARAGTPHLFLNVPDASGDTPAPTPETAQRKSVRVTGINSLTVASTDALGGSYRLLVLASGDAAAEFSVLTQIVCAGEPLYSTLSDNIPQAGAIAMGSWHYYRVYVPPELSGTVVVTLAAESGDPDLYVKTSRSKPDEFPSPTNAQWSSLSHGRDMVVIHPTDPDYCTDCVYEFAIEGYIASVYSISATSGATYGPLVPGRAAESYVARDATDYYVVSLPEAPEGDVALVLTNLGPGDADFYVRTAAFDAAKPAAEQATWKGEEHGSDQIVISATDQARCQAPPCAYFIAVVGYRATSYSVLFSADLPTVLSDGASQDGYAGNGGVRAYMIKVPDVSKQPVRMSVQVFGGRAETYYARDRVPDAADPASYEAKDTSFGANKVYTFPIAVPGNAPKCADPSDCYYFVLVKGSPNAWFSVVGSVQDKDHEVSVQLVDGSPYNVDIGYGAFSYFSVRVTEPGRTLTITVTPTSGDPDLYVSRTEAFPNKTNTAAADQSTAWGADTLVYPNAAVGTYYIGVEAVGSTSAAFSVLAATTGPGDDGDDGAPVQLIDGEPQSYNLAIGAARSFVLRVTPRAEAYTDLMFTFSLERGDVEFYAQYNEAEPPVVTKETAQWDSTQTEASFLWIAAPKPGYYTIKVYARAPTAALFALTATLDNTHVVLQNGIGTPGYLGTDEMTYYKLTVPAGNDLVVSVVALYGNPDVYVSDDAANPYPTKDPAQHQWGSAGSHDDAIFIAKNDTLRSCKGDQCTYYVGVYSAAGDTEYYLTVTTSRPTALIAGIPTSGSAFGNTVIFYAISVQAKDLPALSISVLPTAGTPWLYVRTNAVPTETEGGFEWAMTGAAATGSRLTIERGTGSPEHPFCDGFDAEGKPTECVYYIALVSTEETKFTITASLGGAMTVLREGLPVTLSAAAGAYQNLYFYVQPDPAHPEAAASGSDVMVIVTALSGSPDVFGSYTHEYPTQEPDKHEYESSEWGVDVLTLRDARAGMLYISVFAADGVPTMFTVTAHVVRKDDASRTTLLVDGVPQGGAVLAEGWMFFQIAPSAAAKIMDFTLYATAGDPDLYINASEERPTAQKSDYSSEYAMATDSVRVEDLATVFKDKPRIFTIGVYGYGSATFTLTASSDLTVQRLQAGVPAYDTGIAMHKSYYFIEVDDTSASNDLEFSATVFAGAVRMYGSATETKPSADKHDKEASGFNTNSFTFTDAAKKPYYVSVECVSACYFSLLASFNGRVVLADGVAQSATVAAGSQRSFAFAVAKGRETSEVSVSVMPVTNAVLTAYVRVGGVPNPETPDADTVTQQASSLMTILVAPERMAGGKCGTQTDPSVGCRVYIIIRAAPAGEGEEAPEDVTFTVTAATDAAQITLQDGVPVRDWADKNSPSYYSFYFDNANADIGVTVTPVSSGGTSFMSVHMSTNNTRPDATSEWHSQFYHSTPYIHVDPTSPGFKAKGAYYVAVTAPSEKIYTITLTVTPLGEADAQSVLLLAGRPQSGLVSTGEYRYFRFRSGSDPAVTFTVSPVYGDPDLYVNKNGTRPRQGQADQSADALGGDQIIYTAANGCKNCWYDIAVRGSGKTLFTVVAQTAAQVLELQSGLPITNTLTGAQNAYYYAAYVPRSDYPFVVTLTPASGNPDLYVSRTVAEPSAASCAGCVDPVTKGPCCFIASSAGAETVTVAKPIEKSTYHIAVINAGSGSTGAAAPTTYTLVAHTGAVQLLQGVPQASEVLARQSVLYQYSVSDPETKSDFTFSLSQNSAENPAQMFILAVSSTTATDVVIPSEKQSTWSSTRPDPADSGFRGEVRIHSGDAKACFDCTYLIAVYGSPKIASTSFTLSVTSSAADSVQTLLAGVSVNGVVSNSADAGAASQPRERRYRAYVDSATSDVSIDVGVLFGDVTVLVARSVADLTDDKAKWKGQHIVIAHSDPDFAPGLFFILVRGTADATALPLTSYSITLATDNTLLRFGEPLTTSIRTGGSFFFFKLEDDQADVYVEVQPSAALTAAEAAAMNALSAGSAVSYAPSAVGSPLAAAAAAVSGPLSLSPRFAALAASVSARIGSADASAVVGAAVGAAGEYTLYVSTDASHRHPGPDTPADKVSKFTLRAGQYTAVLLKSDPKYCGHCSYYVGLHGTAGEGVRVSATTPSSVDALTDGVIVDDGVPLYASQFYSISIAHAHDRNMTILVEPCVGRADLYVSYETYKPGKDDANYRAEGQHGLLTIPIASRVSEKAVFNAYTLAVVGAELPKGAAQGQSVVYRLTALSTYKEPLAEPLGALVTESPDVGQIVVTAPLAKLRDYSETAGEGALIAQERLEYFVFFSEVGSGVSLEAPCGMLHEDKASKVGPFTLKTTPKVFDGGRLRVSVEGLKGAHTYAVNVLVVEQDGAVTVGYGLNPGITTLGTLPESYWKLILAIFIPVGVIVMALLAYLAWRNRKLRQELHGVEMTDVPASVVRKAARGPVAAAAEADARAEAAGKKSKYAKLLTEDEGMDDLGDYAPPTQQHGRGGFTAEL